jgi:putrescine transport system permease protein
MVGKMLWTEFFGNKDWPLAAAVAISLLAVLVVPFMMMRHLEQKLGGDEL